MDEVGGEAQRDEQSERGFLHHSLPQNSTYPAPMANSPAPSAMNRISNIETLPFQTLKVEERP